MVPAGSNVERDRLLLMARKLYKFVTPIGLLATALGLWLWFGYGFSGGWLYAKTALVFGLWGYHGVCGRLLKDFAAGRNARSHVWFRIFNEVPVVALVIICILVVVKPF
jgi:putative membrane protein